MKREMPAVAVVPDDYCFSLIGQGLLGATGRDAHEARENRLLEIERRILRIEAALLDMPGNGKEGV